MVDGLPDGGEPVLARLLDAMVGEEGGFFLPPQDLGVHEESVKVEHDSSEAGREMDRDAHAADRRMRRAAAHDVISPALVTGRP
jgi:hypothetical protein